MTTYIKSLTSLEDNMPTALFCLAALSSLFSRISAWGREGHYIAVHIALGLLSKRGKFLATDLLVRPGQSFRPQLYEASVWADIAKDLPQYEWTKRMHYINLPGKHVSGFDYNRDCGAAGYLDVVSGIGMFTEQAGDLTESKGQRGNALKLMMHFLTDLTQPLHIGFAADAGGNAISVRPPWDHAYTKAGNRITTPRKTSLHVVWDSHILQFMLARERKTWEELAEEVVKGIAIPPTRNEGFRDPIKYACATAANTAQLSLGKAYREKGKWIESGSGLGIDYYEEGAEIVKRQLITAGVDIALFINQLAEDLNVPEISDDIPREGETDEESVLFDDEDEYQIPKTVPGTFLL